MAEEKEIEEKVIVTPKEEFKGKTGQGVLFTLLVIINTCLLYTSPSPRDRTRSRMPSSA